MHKQHNTPTAYYVSDSNHVWSFFVKSSIYTDCLYFDKSISEYVNHEKITGVYRQDFFWTHPINTPHAFDCGQNTQCGLSLLLLFAMLHADTCPNGWYASAMANNKVAVFKKEKDGYLFFVRDLQSVKDILTDEKIIQYLPTQPDRPYKKTYGLLFYKFRQNS